MGDYPLWYEFRGADSDDEAYNRLIEEKGKDIENLTDKEEIEYRNSLFAQALGYFEEKKDETKSYELYSKYCWEIQQKWNEYNNNN